VRGVVGNLVVIVGAVALAALIERAFGRRRGPGAGGAALLLLLGLCNGVRADVCTENCESPLKWAGYAVSGRSWTLGEDPEAFVGARIDASLDLPFGLVLHGRADSTQTQDGGAIEGGTRPEVFEVAEFTGLLHRPMVQGIGPAFAYGIAVPMDGPRPQIARNYPQRVFLGVVLRAPGLFLAVGGGLDGAAGSGVKVQLGAQVHLKGNTHIGGDVSFPHAVARSVVLVSWGGSSRE